MLSITTAQRTGRETEWTSDMTSVPKQYSKVMCRAVTKKEKSKCSEHSNSPKTTHDIKPAKPITRLPVRSEYRRDRGRIDK